MDSRIPKRGDYLLHRKGQRKREEWIDLVTADCDENALTTDDMFAAWSVGLAHVLRERDTAADAEKEGE